MLEEAARALAAARRVVVFTGAGVSADSGVPTFRDAQTGLWERYDAQELATAEAFGNDPDLVWGWYEWRRALVSRCQPNAAHRAIVAIEGRAPHCTLVTQNVDDLHERAGSRRPLKLHGSLFSPRCFTCNQPAPLPPLADQPAEGAPMPPPRCSGCGGPVRPGVVWFGEPLPEAALTAALREAQECDVLLAIGTSGVVFPAAQIPIVAGQRGATVIQVNPHPTALDGIATINSREPAAQFLPRLVEAAWGRDGSVGE